ncbi:hypothetical protein KFY57_27150, partial [Salmonella enterica subsp. enterica serovar Typhimurium]|nr:hypothetical protein [Salmonella enterica subsp. enterica serovar Typhimurium]
GQSPLLACVLSYLSEKPSADIEYRCFVGGLAWATTDHALQEAFSTFGDVLESKVGLRCRRDRI